MADAAVGATPLLPGLPNDIAIWEILIRLPPKPLLRCRAVSPAWRRAASSRDFLLSHHARQPNLPLLDSRNDIADRVWSLDLVSFDHRAAGATAADRFQPVARLKPALCERYPTMYLDASRDGLLLLSQFRDGSHSRELCICNPATRQYAPLHQLKGFGLMGMYPHPPTGEYRLLLYRKGEDDGAHVFTLGSAHPPRHIGRPPQPHSLEDSAGIIFQGSMYWYTDYGILVFDTTNELFRRIRRPVGAPLTSDEARVFMMGDMLAIFAPNDECTAIDIWVMQQNHQGEVWDFKCRVKLPVAETRQQCQCSEHEHEHHAMVVQPGDSGLLILIRCNEWLFQVDIDGKLIASFQRPSSITATHHVLKQSLVQHTFFPTLEGYVVNAPPFI